MSNYDSTPTPVLHCPLCSGPLHNQDDIFVCVVGHRATTAEVARHAELRLAEALWMAVEALHSEALVLRLLSDSADAEKHATAAEDQANLLTKFGHRHEDMR